MKSEVCEQVFLNAQGSPSEEHVTKPFVFYERWGEDYFYILFQIFATFYTVFSHIF